MMASLVRRDPAVRALAGRSLAMVLLGGGVVLNVMMVLGSRGRRLAGIEDGPFVLSSNPGTGVFALQIGLAWLLLAGFLLLARALHRCAPFDLALPIPARVIWRSRLVGRILAGTAVIAMLAVVVAIANWGMTHSPLQTSFIGPRGAFALSVHLFAGLCLAASFLGSIEIGLSQAPRNRRSFVALAVSLLGTLLVVLIMSRFGPATALVTLGLAAWVAYRAERDLPPMYAVFPKTLADGPDAAVTTDHAASWNDKASGSGRWFMARVVWKALYGHVLGITLLGVIFLYANFLNGSAMSFDGDSTDTGPVWIPIMWYLLLAFMAKFMKKLYVVDALPISRRFLFGALTLPGLTILLLGYGLGKAVLEYRGDPTGTFIVVEEEGYPDLRVALEHFRIAWGGDPPPLTSPWGETHEAKTVPVLTDGQGILYKPYTTPEGSSLDFVALQISRAIETIYGHAVTGDQVAERYLMVNADGAPALRDGGAPLTEDLASLTPRGRGRVFPVILVATVVPWLLMLAALLRGHRMGLTVAQQKIRVAVVMGVALIVQMGLVFLAVGDLLDLHAYSSLIKSFGHQVCDTLPGGIITAWILAFVIVAVAYRFAESAFQRVEASMENKAGCSW